MARVQDLPLKYRLLVKAYPWRRIDPVPCARLSKSVSDSRIALVTSAGLVPPGEPLFDEGITGGDYSYRIIPRATDVRSLIESHRSDAFDHSGIAQDRNLVFPLDRLEELEAARLIGEVAPRHLSFMGSITAPRRLTTRTAPAAATKLVEDGADAAILVPV